MPVPGKSRSLWSRWKAPNSLPAKVELKPAPSSRTKKASLPPALGLAELDGRPRVLGRELPGVAEQVLQDDPQQAGVAVRGQPRLDHEVGLPTWLQPLQFRRDRPGEGAEVHSLALHVAAGQAGQLQQVVNELGHPLAAGPHPLEVVLALLVQLRRRRSGGVPGRSRRWPAAGHAGRARRCSRTPPSPCWRLPVGPSGRGRDPPTRALSLRSSSWACFLSVTSSIARRIIGAWSSSRKTGRALSSRAFRPTCGKSCSTSKSSNGWPLAMTPCNNARSGATSHPRPPSSKKGRPSAWLFWDLKGLVEDVIRPLHPQVRVKDEQRVAYRLHYALGKRSHFGLLPPPTVRPRIVRSPD